MHYKLFIGASNWKKCYTSTKQYCYSDSLEVSVYCNGWASNGQQNLPFIYQFDSITTREYNNKTEQIINRLYQGSKYLASKQLNSYISIHVYYNENELKHMYTMLPKWITLLNFLWY
jgi:hypothetical protein